METNKESKFQKLSLYIIFGLSTLLAISIVLNIYFYYKSRIRLFDCNLGQDIEVTFFEQSDQLLANIVYPSNIVSGTKYNQKVMIESQDLQKQYYIRAKVVYADYNLVDENIIVDISPNEDWLQGLDNYFYLNRLLEDYDNIIFFDELTLPSITTSVKNNTTISIIFQFLDSGQDITKIWNPPSDFSLLI